jgi:putative two-component system response regulator
MLPALFQHSSIDEIRSHFFNSFEALVMQKKPALADILVVDDDPGIQGMMRRILVRSGYHVHSADGGQAAFDQIAVKIPDLIILDLSMPGLDGFEVAAYLKSRPETQQIPILLITGLDTSKNHVKAMDIGVNDFLSKTAEPEEILARIRSHLKIKQLNDELSDYRKSLEKMVALRTLQLKDASLEVIWRLTAASEYRDNETGAHIKRMSHYSAAMARHLGLANKTVDTILYGAPMHDIGKIGIPDRILLKPGKLDDAEWAIMKQHPLMGANILEGSKIGFVRMGAMIAKTHHEKWDGSGYPQGLKAKQIPLAGRIVALADVFDALTSERPYKKAFSIEKANQIIEQGRGHHFDPAVVAAFFAVQAEILDLKERFQDEKHNQMFCLDHMSNNGTVDSISECSAL